MEDDTNSFLYPTKNNLSSSSSSRSGGGGSISLL